MSSFAKHRYFIVFQIFYCQQYQQQLIKSPGNSSPLKANIIPFHYKSCFEKTGKNPYVFYTQNPISTREAPTRLLA